MAIMKKDQAFIEAAGESSGLDKLTVGISQVGLGMIMSLAGLIGIWGIACLISGIAQSGGVMTLARSWLAAVTGM
jgi:hypothetical protein